MKTKVLITLEYDKIIDRLMALAISPTGQAMARQLTPSTDKATILSSQKETTEAVNLSLKLGRLTLRGFRDLSNPFKRLSIGSVLSIGELLQLGDFLRATKTGIDYYRQMQEKELTGILDPFFNQLEPLTHLRLEIERCILSEEDVADHASSNLTHIRRNIRNSQAKIKSQLTSLTQSLQTYLQDNLITQRNGRYCLPVKLEYRQQVKGIVHDQSSTGSTLFIEPIAIVNLNNQLNQLAIEEKKEIERIISHLSTLAADEHPALVLNSQMMTLLDFIFAKAELSLSLSCSEPLFNDEQHLHLKKARHPLLDPKSVVPSTIYLGGNFNSLVITGPNTGGKTVTLKTIGLLSLMGQSGLHIPAFDGSTLPIFNSVFADIGDEQSIEQSLSTFSSHMVTIVDILKQANHQSLVLFDELGAGTDPVEGAALAMAILDNLRERGSLIAATTHYSELKVYALSTAGVENASCEFDVTTLKPTYHLLIGVPGKSNAFAISKRLGLNQLIIDQAKQRISGQEVRFEDLITDLETSQRKAQAEKEKASRLRHEQELAKQSLKQQQENLAASKERLLTQARQEAYTILEEAKQEADATLRRINQLVRQGKKLSVTNLEKERSHLQDKLKEVSIHQTKASSSKSGKAPTATQLTVGQTVYVTSFEQNGTLLSLPNANGQVEVQLGILKSTVALTDLRTNHSTSSTKKSPSNRGRQATLPNSTTSSGRQLMQSPGSQVDLRGLNGLDAIEKLDKYLDDAYLSNLNQVTVVHGKGTGALRKQIQSFLRTSAHVSDYRLGQFGEGGAGVTIVELKDN